MSTTTTDRKDMMMTDERPLLDTVLAMTAASLERTNLGDREVMLVRLAALAAVDAPPSSYLLNLAAARDAGVAAADVQGVLVAIAPIVGSPRVVSAAGTIAAALGIAVAIDDALTAEGADDIG
jgi:alkylhydroperoxidase/carboxymuconolactone decarboxylase family protein YurZ